MTATHLAWVALKVGAITTGIWVTLGITIWIIRWTTPEPVDIGEAT